MILPNVILVTGDRKMNYKSLVILLCIGLSFGCKKADTTATDTTAAETAQQIGDNMASVDESGGSSSGAIAAQQSAAEKTFARLEPDDINKSISQFLLPNAEAASCGSASEFSGCTSGVITRTFGGCTVGSATFTGTVSLTFAGTGSALCRVNGANGDSVTRVPSFTVTGRRGATLTVSKTGTIGQKVSRTGINQFAFTNDGINRKFTAPDATVLFDQTTGVPVSSPIVVTGASRAGRVMNGGILRVQNNKTSVTCDYTPANVTWEAGCNCPTSGSWTGTCTNSNTTTLTITGCGTANFTDGSFSGVVTLDRCGS